MPAISCGHCWKRSDTMKHDIPSELLNGYLDGELLPEQKADFEKHLNDCAQCRQELDALRQLDERIKTREIEEPSRDFFFGVNRRIAERIGKPRRFSLLRLSPVLVPVAAGIVVIALVSVNVTKNSATLDDRVAYVDIKEKREISVEIPDIVPQPAQEKAAPSMTRVLSAQPEARVEEVGAGKGGAAAAPSAAPALPMHKVVRVLVDSTGTVLRAATGTERVPEKDTALEKLLEGQQLEPATVEGKKLLFYVGTAQEESLTTKEKKE